MPEAPEVVPPPTPVPSTPTEGHLDGPIQPSLEQVGQGEAQQHSQQVDIQPIPPGDEYRLRCPASG
eukprot:3942521-Alexandrium_andersonii.AAC.1